MSSGKNEAYATNVIMIAKQLVDNPRLAEDVETMVEYYNALSEYEEATRVYEAYPQGTPDSNVGFIHAREDFDDATKRLRHLMTYTRAGELIADFSKQLHQVEIGIAAASVATSTAVSTAATANPT
jgi:cell fate (sporulation/competence/biofilm development) regulator YlbF (YheA/YmcA/DUF963 family)